MSNLASPDPGSSLPIYLKALGETLSIALLGTTLAAVFALPVSLLAARNVVPSMILRFPISLKALGEALLPRRHVRVHGAPDDDVERQECEGKR